MNLEQLKPYFFTAADGIRGAADEVEVPAVLSRLTFCVLDLGDGRVAIGKNHGRAEDRHYSAEIGRHFARTGAIRSAEWLLRPADER